MKRLVPIIIILSMLWPAGGLSVAQALTKSATNVPFTVINTVVTWNLAGSPYVVQGDVQVQTGGSLTIDPGVVVEFDASPKLQVFSGGRLTATGSVTSSIVFTSSAGSPAPDAWPDIQLLAGRAPPVGRERHAPAHGRLHASRAEHIGAAHA